MAYYKHPPMGGKEGKVTYNKSIVRNIVILAVAEVEGAKLYSPKKNDSIKIMNSPDGINVMADIVVGAEHCVTDISFKVQENIKRNVETMTEYKIGKIDINVKDIIIDGAENEHKK